MLFVASAIRLLLITLSGSMQNVPTNVPTSVWSATLAAFSTNDEQRVSLRGCSCLLTDFFLQLS
jgi:hypothetical protein